MTLSKLLDDFIVSITGATTRAPDEYPAQGAWTYESNRADILELWSQILPKIKKDIEQANFVDLKIKEAFAAFDEGDKARGRQALWDIYNAKPERLR